MISKEQEKWNKYINEGGPLNKVPKEYITQEMSDKYWAKYWAKYMEDTGELSDIPIKFRTQKIYDQYVKKHHILYGIPDEYITQEMCNYIMSKGSSIYLIPERFLTQEMCVKSMLHKGDLEDVPEKFRNQEVYKIYIDNGGVLQNVPEKFITQEMCNTYISNHGSLENVPEKFITQDICNIYMEKTAILENVPEKFITQEMCDRYVSWRGTISNVPEKFITQEMCEIYISRGGKIDKVPEKFRTKELYEQWYEKNKKYKIIEDLVSGEIEYTTKKDLIEKYNITENRLDIILEGIKQVKPEIYEQIKNKFKHNMLKHFYGIEKDINTVMSIVDSLGEKPKTFKRVGTAYTKEQKIQFSYSLSHANINHSIFELYKLAISGNLKFNCEDFIRFCRNDLGMRFHDVDANALLDEEQLFIKMGNNWLRSFDEKSFLRDSQGHEIKHAYLDNNGNHVEIKEPDIQIILNCLKANAIPKSTCIVTEAIRKYVKGELDIFINDLISGEYLSRNYTPKSNTNKKH